MISVERIQRGGRPVHGFALGAGSGDTIDSGIATLQAAVAQPGVTVASLQAAGNAAVGAVGPAIDTLSGSNPDVMKLTQQVWQLNGKLAGVNDVDTAKALTSQMITIYQQAQKLAVGGSGLLDWVMANKTVAIVSGAAVVIGGFGLMALRSAGRSTA